MKQIVLASQSPRRAEILKKALYCFVSFPVYVSEIPDKNLSLDQQILDISERKARECKRLLQAEGLAESNLSENRVILAADTMVCLDGRTFGKPDDKQQAFQMLSLLSGRNHQVKTAVYMIDLTTDQPQSLVETTEVYFKNLTSNEIWTYIQTGEPLDKAGAYGIQGFAGQFVEKYVGDFDNVVGLPLQAIEKVFKLMKWEFLRN